MVAEFAETITKEVDFNNERRNQIRFGHFFANDPAIHVPLFMSSSAPKAS